MHTALLALVLATLALLSPISLSLAKAVHSPSPQATVSVVPVLHYTRGGVVQLNPMSGATRFIPYRLAKGLDRRSLGSRSTQL